MQKSIALYFNLYTINNYNYLKYIMEEVKSDKIDKKAQVEYS